MPTFRFSLLTLLGVTAYVAIGAAALTHPSIGWLSAVESAVYICLAIVTIVAIYGVGGSRPFCVGFLIVGWISMLRLQTEVLKQWRYVEEATLPAVWITASLGWWHGSQVKVVASTVHLLCTFPLACLGGIIARALYARNSRDSDTGDRNRPA